MRGARGCTSLDQREPQTIVEAGMITGGGVENIASKAPIAGPRLDEIEMFGPRSLEQAPHLGQLHGNQLAEQGAYVDAGVEVPALARTLRRRRVVAVLRMVERELHELGDSDRPSLTNVREQQR